MVLIKKVSLVDQIYKQMREKIMTLRYPMGSRLNVRELQTVFDVSSTPLREAIARLQAEGLVNYETNVGGRVIALTPKDVQDIQVLALTLHSAAIRLAVAQGDRAKLVEEMWRAVGDYEKAKSSEAKIRSVINLSRSFYRHSGNSRLEANITVIQGQQVLLRNLFYRGSSKDFSEQYRAMAQAAEQGDAEAMIVLLTNIYNEATPILLEALEKLVAE